MCDILWNNQFDITGVEKISSECHRVDNLGREIHLCWFNYTQKNYSRPTFILWRWNNSRWNKIQSAGSSSVLPSIVTVSTEINYWEKGVFQTMKKIEIQLILLILPKIAEQTHTSNHFLSLFSSLWFRVELGVYNRAGWMLSITKTVHVFAPHNIQTPCFVNRDTGVPKVSSYLSSSRVFQRVFLQFELRRRTERCVRK